jgi:hypothetical protein
MSDTFQLVVVTAVAALALAVLVRPLFTGKKAARPAKPGCASCAEGDAHHDAH